MTDIQRQVYVNRTLNMRSVEAIGYDMDYTLIHYNVDQWESEAFLDARAELAKRGLPVSDFVFHPDEYIQGLVLDLHLGNIVKATRWRALASGAATRARCGRRSA